MMLMLMLVRINGVLLIQIVANARVHRRLVLLAIHFMVLIMVLTVVGVRRMTTDRRGRLHVAARLRRYTCIIGTIVIVSTTANKLHAVVVVVAITIVVVTIATAIAVSWRRVPILLLYIGRVGQNWARSCDLD